MRNSFKKYPPWAWWVMGGQIVSEFTMNSPWACQVNTPLPQVQVVWMHTLMGELSYHLRLVPICGDNQGSIFIASNPVTEKRFKHIDIRHHYIREVVERKFAEIFFINRDKSPADLLTKNLGSVKFQLF